MSEELSGSDFVKKYALQHEEIAGHISRALDLRDEIKVVEARIADLRRREMGNVLAAYTLGANISLIAQVYGVSPQRIHERISKYKRKLNPSPLEIPEA